MPSCIGVRHLHPIVMAFQQRHPAVTVDLILENRDIDLVYENFDLAVRYGRPAGQELIIRRLGLIRRILVAAPSFLARFGPIDTPERLSEIDIVSSARLLSPRDTLALQHRSGETLDLPAHFPLGPQPRRQHCRVVAKQNVSRPKKPRQIGEGVMRDASLGPIHHEQPRLIPASHGRLRYEVWRQIVIKKIGGKRRHGGEIARLLARRE